MQRLFTCLFVCPCLCVQSLRDSRRAEADDRHGSLHGDHGSTGCGAQPRLQEHWGRTEPLRRVWLLFLPRSAARATQLVGQPPLQLLQVQRVSLLQLLRLGLGTFRQITSHSLTALLSQFPNQDFVFFLPKKLLFKEIARLSYLILKKQGWLEIKPTLSSVVDFGGWGRLFQNPFTNIYSVVVNYIILYRCKFGTYLGKIEQEFLVNGKW